MSLSEDKKQKFIDWLYESRGILPGKMRLSEAQELFERKVRDDEEIKQEDIRDALRKLNGH